MQVQGSSGAFVTFWPSLSSSITETLSLTVTAHNSSWSAAVERTVTGLGFDLVDVERSGGGLLRVTIDRVPGRSYPTGESEFVLVEDCEAVTRQLQYVLEVENCDYTRLEVSSPGLDRPLKLNDAEFARFAGQQAEVTLRQPFQGRKKWSGELQAREGGWRLVLPRAPVSKTKAKAMAAAGMAPEAEETLDFALEELREARLVPVLDFKGRGRPARPDAGPQAGDQSDDGGQEE
jgi:ribosome maturation factor RimP